MAQQNWWDEAPVIGGGTAPAAPAVILGAPKVPAPQAPPTAIELERLRLAQEEAARSARKEAEGSVEQKKAAGFLRRGLNAERTYGGLGKVEPRSLVGQTFTDKFPGAAPYVSDVPRQKADQTEREFIAAILRYDSGAAIPDNEYVSAKAIYYPRAGETDPTLIAQKAQSRMEALRSLEDAAGFAGSQFSDQFTELSAPDDDPGLEVTVTDDRPEGLTGSVSDDTPSPYDPGGPLNLGKNFDPKTDGAGNLLAQGFTLGMSDELAGLGEAMAAFVNDGRPLSAYQRGRDEERARLDAARGELGWAGTAAEFLPSLAVGGPIIKGATALGTAAKSGAAIGALSGFGYGDGLGGSAAGTALGGVAGGVLGAFGQKAADYIGSRLPARSTLGVDRDVIEAGARQNIPIRQPDARPNLRGDMALAETTEMGGPLIRSAREADAAAMGDRVTDIGAGRAFDRADTTSIGQSAQRIAERGQDNVKTAAGALYQRSERLAPDFKVPGSQTIAHIDQKIAELKARSPSGYEAEVSALENMKADLSETGLSVATLQAQRETVGGRIGDNIADRTRADATLTEVLKVAGNELHGSLSAANPQAAALLKRADAKWGQFKDLQREVTGLLLGKRGDATAETAARQLNSMVNGKGNYSALRRFMTLATPEEKADFATTFAQEWGATGRGEFSPAIFAKNMEKASDRTLNALFGSDGRRALRDIQVIANAKTASGSRQQPSGLAVTSAAGGLKTLLWAGLGLSAGGPGGAAAGAVARGFVAKWGERRAAKMLLNPDFTKWLRQAPNTGNPRAIDAYFRKLGNISTIAANDNQAFQSALREAFASNARVVKADESTEKP